MQVKIPDAVAGAATRAIAITTASWRPFLIGAAMGAAAVIAVVLTRGTQLDAKLVQAKHVVTADSAARVVQMAMTDTVRAAAAEHATASARIDTVWLEAKRTALDSVPAIVSSSAPDTVKIRDLVHVIDTLIVRGDSLAHANVLLVADVRGLDAQIDSERAASSRVIDDEAKALRISESEHRHWGFGCSGGPGLMDVAGAGRLSLLSVSCGLTYRR